MSDGKKCAEAMRNIWDLFQKHTDKAKRVARLIEQEDTYDGDYETECDEIFEASRRRRMGSSKLDNDQVQHVLKIVRSVSAEVNRQLEILIDHMQGMCNHDDTEWNCRGLRCNVCFKYLKTEVDWNEYAKQCEKNSESNKSRYQTDENGMIRVRSKRGSMLHREYLEEQGHEVESENPVKNGCD